MIELSLFVSNLSIILPQQNNPEASQAVLEDKLATFCSDSDIEKTLENIVAGFKNKLKDYAKGNGDS